MARPITESIAIGVYLFILGIVSELVIRAQWRRWTEREPKAPREASPPYTSALHLKHGIERVATSSRRARQWWRRRRNGGQLED